MFGGRADQPNAEPLLVLLGMTLPGVAPVTVTTDRGRTRTMLNAPPGPVGLLPRTLIGRYAPVGHGRQVYVDVTNDGAGPDTLTAACIVAAHDRRRSPRTATRRRRDRGATRGSAATGQ